MALERELGIYLSKLPELKTDNEGKFVLIHGDQVIDIFSSYEDAINAGYGQFGLEPFLVKQIHALELYAALRMFQSGELSAGAAAELAEVDRFTFAAECQKHGIPLVDYPAEDLRAELAALRPKA